MRSFKIFYFILLLTFGLASCRKYVEIPIQGQRVLVYTDDYRYLMNDANQLQVAFGQATVLGSDDLDLSLPVQNSIKTSYIQTAMYIWNKPFYTGKDYDYDWNGLYKSIYTLNTVIAEVMDSKGGSVEAKNIIRAEALVHRAFTYFMLVNLHGKQYDSATAGNDPGVPIQLEAALFTDLTRASVQKVYDQVLADVKQAIPMLPVVQDINFRPNKAAAYALLSKVYLFMRNFKGAAEFADSTLALSSALYNLNDAQPLAGKFPSQYLDKQVLLRKTIRSSFGAPQLSASLLTLLDTIDLRYTFFVRTGNNFNPAFTGKGYWPRNKYSAGCDMPAVGLSVNETWLIKAECLARAGKRAEAVTLINDFRKFRFKPADYKDLTAATNDDALRMVINERRLEFFGTGMRWFDQRRLNKDPMFTQTVTRVFDNVTYTLQPNSNSYVFPIADILILQNPEIEQNPK